MERAGNYIFGLKASTFKMELEELQHTTSTSDANWIDTGRIASGKGYFLSSLIL